MDSSKQRYNVGNEEKATRLVHLELPISQTLHTLLEPADRRFMALGWTGDGLCVYDGWTEYDLDDLSPRDIFGDSWAMPTAFGADNAHQGCGEGRILIDFAQGKIYAGDEMVVEEVLERVVAEQYYRSPLAQAFKSLEVRVPLDAGRPGSV